MDERTARPRVLVLGCGFGGYSVLSRLDPKHWDLTLLTPRNYFLFTPLLASAVVGTVEYRSILEPARRRLGDVRVIEGAALSADFDRREIEAVGSVDGARFTVGYDRLIIGVGAEVHDYGVPGVAENAFGLYTVEDARAIRRRILEQLARAEVPGRPPEEILRLLTFVVCGGGPTGVEVAAEIHDLLENEVTKSYPELAPHARVLLVEALPRVLTGFDEALAEYTHRHFLREGIELRLGARVAAIEPDRVVLDGGEELPAGLTIWAGGNRPVPFVRRLEERGARLTERGRIVVDERLRVPGFRGVYALGDCAAVGEPPLPATAQVAQRQGKYLARSLERVRRGREAKPFSTETSGMLAYIGAGRALVDLPRVKWSGRTAWLFWRSVYLTKLVSLSNKAKVLLDWWKARLFGRDLSRF